MCGLHVRSGTVGFGKTAAQYFAFPGVITRDRENNVVCNPAHPDFGLIRAPDPELVFWDARLFR
jgi:hypothetical protein